MKLAQLPVEILDRVLNALAAYPYRDVAPIIALAQQSTRVVDDDTISSNMINGGTVNLAPEGVVPN